MNKFEIRYKFHELIHNKMMHVVITPETALDRFLDAFLINSKSFWQMFSAEDLYQILSDPQMPEPLRSAEDPAEEARAIIEVILNEELHYLSQHIREKLSAIFSYDFGGIHFSKAVLEFKNIYALTGDDPEEDEESQAHSYEILYELAAAEKIDSHQIAGVVVTIIQAPSTRKTFGRVNLAGFDLLLMRDVKCDDNGRHLSSVSSG